MSHHAPVASTANGSPTAHEIRLRAAASALVERMHFADRAGLSFEGDDGVFRRDLYAALGYKKTLTIDDYRARYERGGIAERIVEAYPRACWTGGADLVEDPDPGVETPFEEAARDLFERVDGWAMLLRATILAGLGRYGALLIGADGEPSEELPRMSGPDDVLYLRPLPEDRAKILKFVDDPTNPRHGLPETYQVTVGETKGRVVHWTRIVHLADGLLENEVYGKPRLRAVWNYLDDLTKCVGGGSEATWRRARPTTLFDLDPEMELAPGEEEKLAAQIEEIVHGFKEFARTRGIKPHSLTQSVPGFGPNAESVLQLISGTTGIPKRILTGSERGEQASTQDRDNWNDRVSEYRLESGEPAARSLVNRLIEFGALPAPSEYTLVWPANDELSEGEKAEVVGLLADANKAQSEAGGGLILTADEIRNDLYGKAPLEEVVDEDEPLPAAALRGPERLRAAKLRLAATKGHRAAAFDPEDLPANLPEREAVRRAAESHLDSLAAAVLAAWDGGAAEMDLEALEVTLAFGDAASAEGHALEALAAADAHLTEALPQRLLATLTDGGLAALQSTRTRGSWFRSNAKADPFRAAQFRAEFDATNPRAISWAEARAAGLIVEIGPDTVAAVRALIARGLDEGIPPRKLAAEIRQAVGLRSGQVDAIGNLRAELKAAKPGAVVKRFPPREGVRDLAGFRAKVPAGGATDAWVDGQVERYTRMQRNYRARTIARTETMRSANEGQRELWRQAQDSGQLRADQKRVWLKNTERHAYLDGEVVGIDEPFSGGFEPGEPPNCGCGQGIATPEDLRGAGL